MVWPTALTTNADILKYIWEQGITRKLQSGNNYDDLHEGVAIEIRNWLESKGGVNNADNIINVDAFKPAAAHLFWGKVIRNVDLDLSETYIQKHLALLRSTRPDLKADSDPASSGTAAKVVVYKQGSKYYTGRRSGQVFQDRRV